MFKLFKKKEKLYKIVYQVSNWSIRGDMTLIVAAADPVKAIKEFYRIVGTGVASIVEFKELRED